MEMRMIRNYKHEPAPWPESGGRYPAGTAKQCAAIAGTNGPDFNSSLEDQMIRILTLMVVTAALSACGLAETGVAAATTGASAAEQAREAEKITDRVEADLEAAQQAAAEARRAAEAASQ
jgi:hypothetical protein